MSDYERVRQHARDELERIGGQIASGDNSELLAWVVQSEIAGAHRPLRYDPMYGGRQSFSGDPRPRVEGWVDRVIAEGIRTVFCLATDGELRRYDDLGFHPDGFLAYLRERGLEVRHLPLTDPAHLPLGESKGWKEVQLSQVQRDAAALYEEAEKPVLVFCSGGADRTPPVVAYLVTASTG
jgi:protein tyrosine phosphatase (PTP) superfamily phosphohydrolase (DUF442 family)